MYIYLNESTLENQFYAIDDFKDALREMYKILDALGSMEGEKHVFHSERLWYQPVMNHEIFSQIFNRLPDKSLYKAFVNIFRNKLNSKPWEAERTHLATDTFRCRKEDVTSRSIAEVAARSHSELDTKYLLVNFEPSRFSKSRLRVVKVGFFRTSVYGASTCDEFGAWTLKNGLSFPKYEATSLYSPRDFHTALSDVTRYIKTSMPPVHGRSVYREISSGRLYYVDSNHKGKSAHLEVFDHNCNHLGKATLDGQLIQGTAEDRTIND
ncbi:MAG: hypothetical protein ACD_80C00223G0001 [uncultured bacterium (gcode 4)]|uniref:Uncharacterized protein n=1 Tax=uncultured bacterium (gcode 4) TaxID=1234023 RepID=K1XGU8_9BACT|nr:MAG: hypothetical protein ACD_80C00223G0001 [uncultured bacterium (gcode 4)]